MSVAAYGTPGSCDVGNMLANAAFEAFTQRLAPTFRLVSPENLDHALDPRLDCTLWVVSECVQLLHDSERLLGAEACRLRALLCCAGASLAAHARSNALRALVAAPVGTLAGLAAVERAHAALALAETLLPLRALAARAVAAHGLGARRARRALARAATARRCHLAARRCAARDWERFASGGWSRRVVRSSRRHILHETTPTGRPSVIFAGPPVLLRARWRRLMAPCMRVALADVAGCAPEVRVAGATDAQRPHLEALGYRHDAATDVYAKPLEGEDTLRALEARHRAMPLGAAALR